MKHYLQSKKEKYISFPALSLLKFYQSRKNKIKGYVLLCQLIALETTEFFFIKFCNSIHYIYLLNTVSVKIL